MKAIQSLDVNETNSIAKALLVYINEYSNLPVDKIEFQSLYNDKSCMSLYNLDGSGIIEKYISGSYRAQYNFSIVYRSKPTNSNQRIYCEHVLNDIAQWLIDSNSIRLSDKREVTGIEILKTASLASSAQNGIEDYHIILNLKYSKKVR